MKGLLVYLINQVYKEACTGSRYLCQRPLTKQKGANLAKLEDATFLKIVTNQESPDKFDDFVKEWKKLGGDQITKEVEKDAAAH